MSENGSTEQVPVTPVGYPQQASNPPQQGHPSPHALQPVKPPPRL